MRGGARGAGSPYIEGAEWGLGSRNQLDSGAELLGRGGGVGIEGVGVEVPQRAQKRQVGWRAEPQLVQKVVGEVAGVVGLVGVVGLGLRGSGSSVWVVMSRLLRRFLAVAL